LNSWKNDRAGRDKDKEPALEDDTKRSGPGTRASCALAMPGMRHVATVLSPIRSLHPLVIIPVKIENKHISGGFMLET